MDATNKSGKGRVLVKCTPHKGQYVTKKGYERANSRIWVKGYGSDLEEGMEQTGMVEVRHESGGFLVE